jgi:hypothetical protein
MNIRLDLNNMFFEKLLATVSPHE